MDEQPTRTDDEHRKVKRLILCFDGTWNTPEDQTNVSRIYAAVGDQHSGCKSQLKFYDSGVGTTRRDRFRGGVLGRGLDENILEGYCWLIEQYLFYGRGEPESDGEVFDLGPDIFIFGFSRGAFTARSLAGLVNRCGIPKREQFQTEGGHSTVDSPLVREAWKLYQEDLPSEARKHEKARSFRATNSYDAKIKFLGVWDTVGALGVPMFSRSIFARAKYGFHDMKLGRVIERAFHAMAIDEQREDYRVSLWRERHSVGTQSLEQRWFPGAHANVGGGYEDDLLPDPPLKWMAERAIAAGLEFTDEMGMKLGSPGCKNALPDDFKLRGDEYLSPVRDSYADFLHGVYRVGRALIFKGRYARPMLVEGIAETIDETANMKWAADHRYRPVNFAAAGRSDTRSASQGTQVVVTATPAASGSSAGT